MFFSCGCGPCRRLAGEFAEKSEKMVLTGIIEKPELDEFIEATDWRGESWLDPGTAFAIRHRMADCPKLAVEVNGALKEIAVAEAHKRLRESVAAAGGKG